MSTKPNYKLRKTVLGTASVLTGFAVAGTLTAGTAEAVVIQAGNGKEILLPVNVQEKGKGLVADAKPELSEKLVAKTEKGTGVTADAKPELKIPTGKGTGVTVEKPELKVPTEKGAGVTADPKSELPVSALLALAPEKPELDPSLLFSTSEPASAPVSEPASVPGITSPVTSEPKPEGELSTGNTNKDVKVEGKKEVKSGKVKGTKAEGKVLPKTSATTATSVALPLGLAAALLTVGLISLRRKNN